MVVMKNVIKISCDIGRRVRFVRLGIWDKVVHIGGMLPKLYCTSAWSSVHLLA